MGMLIFDVTWIILSRMVNFVLLCQVQSRNGNPHFHLRGHEEWRRCIERKQCNPHDCDYAERGSAPFVGHSRRWDPPNNFSYIIDLETFSFPFRGTPPTHRITLPISMDLGTFWAP